MLFPMRICVFFSVISNHNFSKYSNHIVVVIPKPYIISIIVINSPNRCQIVKHSVTVTYKLSNVTIGIHPTAHLPTHKNEHLFHIHIVQTYIIYAVAAAHHSRI